MSEKKETSPPSWAVNCPTHGLQPVEKVNKWDESIIQFLSDEQKEKFGLTENGLITANCPKCGDTQQAFQIE